MNNMMKNKMKNNIYFIVFAVLAILMISRIVNQFTGSKKMPESSQTKKFKFHYALIVRDDEGERYQSFYQGAEKAGSTHGVYVENFKETFGKDLSTGELMELAISARVDGIILEAGSSEGIEHLINQASESNIPVITVWRDSPNSKRKCFVGTNGYYLGEVYGELINSLDLKEGDIIELLQNERVEQSLRMEYSGIKDSMDQEWELRASFVNEEDLFGAETAIQGAFSGNQARPGVLVCFNESDTETAIRMVIDYNLVGKVKILGYYQDTAILDAIQKGIVKATVGIDAEEVGTKAVEALYKCRTQKYINEYEVVDPYVIDKNNLAEHQNGSENE